MSPGACCYGVLLKAGVTGYGQCIFVYFGPNTVCFTFMCVYIYSVCESRKRTVCVRVGGGCEGRGRTMYECVNVYVCVPFVSSFSPSFCFLICSLDSLERTLKHSQRERDVDITKIETQYTQRKTNTVLSRCRGRRPPTRYLVREEADRSLTWSDRWVVRCS